jgi:Ca2+-transporting ATPase
VLPEEKTLTPFKIFFSQFANPIIYILVVAGLVSFFLKKYLDIGLIASVVVVNALMGFFQEYKTQKTLVALKKLITPTAKVFRDGAKQVVLQVSLSPVTQFF